jgi:hypothetical protein
VSATQQDLMSSDRKQPADEFLKIRIEYKLNPYAP